MNQGLQLPSVLRAMMGDASFFPPKRIPFWGICLFLIFLWVLEVHLTLDFQCSTVMTHLAVFFAQTAPPL